MATWRPAEVFPPGEFLRDELEERGWTQTDLAEIVDRPVGLINGIINGKRGITPETARDLSAAFGTSPEFWMNLEASYQLSRIKDNDKEAIACRAKLYAAAPVKEMVRRGWIEPSESVEVLTDRVTRFLGVEDIDDEPDLFRHAARKSTSYVQPPTPAQKAWVCRAAQMARVVQTRPYTKANLDEALGRLLLLRHAPAEVRHVPRILSDAGIRFVIVQHLPSTKIDGACFWIDDSPAIAMSVRFDRFDNFWFCLMHELGHVLQEGESLDDDLLERKGDVQRPKSERDADEFAVENLIPQRQLENFIVRVRPLYNVRNITAFAHTIGVHPGLVVGQLQHRGEVPYSSYRQTLAPVRNVVTEAALTDGWGATLPTQL